MYEFVAYFVCEKLEGQGSPIKSEEGRCSSYFSCEISGFVHNIFTGVPFHKLDCSSTWERRLRAVNYVVPSNQNPTTFSPSQIFMRAQKCEINLIIFLQVKLLMAAKSSTIDAEHDIFLFCGPHIF